MPSLGPLEIVLLLLCLLFVVGMVAGVVQVPPDGQPVLFLADHPVTGGYPVIAVLHSSALDKAGQLAPDHVIRFVRASGSTPQ